MATITPEAAETALCVDTESYEVYIEVPCDLDVMVQELPDLMSMAGDLGAGFDLLDEFSWEKIPGGWRIYGFLLDNEGGLS